MSENTTPNLQPEVSLPIAPTIGEIDHFRIINKNGESQKATITQVRELIPYVGENLILGNTSHVGVFSPNDNYAFANRQLKSLKKGVYSFSAAEIQRSIGSPAGYSIIIMNSSFASTLAIVQIPTGELSGILNIEQDVSNPIILMYSGIAGQTAGNAVNYSDIKLELGTKATPYIPNPADIARAIDYSKLEEQVVHGEYWIVNGVKKQVYTKTLTGTTPSPWSAVELPLAGSPVGVTALSLVVGHVGGSLLPNWSLAGSVQEWTLRYAANLIQLGVPNYPTTSLNGCLYSLTFKYTY